MWETVTLAELFMGGSMEGYVAVESSPHTMRIVNCLHDK